MNPGPSEALQRSVSSSIDVPKRLAPFPGGDSRDIPAFPGIIRRALPDGFDTDCEPFPRDEPAPRRRKNSVVFKCLWPGCGKELRSVVGIKRHVRTRHLRDGPDSEHRKQEEDFYYTATGCKSTNTAGIWGAGAEEPLSPHTPPSVRAAGKAPRGFPWEREVPRPDPDPLPPCQALPSIQIPVSPHIFTSISWAAATSTLPSLSPVRAARSLPSATFPLRVSLSTRKVRGEAKKCRKVYGIEHRDQWCTACRWKKACQRFLD
ncbi:PREDICTED: zinc finger protein 395 [Corvus brachyrhynchos]|uniref:zinc finger protein 395 n=1 Tax=Corvus brachyrhynchos TaxID=85066 RepID=UPI0008163504|nr:PREDICTED: zinc finger protein 395 [Corvus brachyrhynchos]